MGILQDLFDKVEAQLEKSHITPLLIQTLTWPSPNSARINEYTTPTMNTAPHVNQKLKKD